MKEILAVISLCLVSAQAEAPSGPYPASGWKPSGPSFDLPQRNLIQSSNQRDSYLPPKEEQRPTASEYGAPEEDVSVQGLPAQEQVPLFVTSPINGQQYVGRQFTADLKLLNEQLRQLEAQRQKLGQFGLQQNLESSRSATESEDEPNQFVPRQLVPSLNYNPNFNNPTTGQDAPSTTEPSRDTLNFRTNINSQLPATASPSDNNKDDSDDETSTDEASSFRTTPTSETNQQPQQQEANVDISKQLIRQLPVISLPQALQEQQLAYQQQQLATQSQYTPLPVQQIGQIRAPVFYEPNQLVQLPANQNLIAQTQPAIGQLINGYPQNQYAPAVMQVTQRQISVGQPEQSVLQAQSYIQGSQTPVRFSSSQLVSNQAQLTQPQTFSQIQYVQPQLPQNQQQYVQGQQQFLPNQQQSDINQQLLSQYQPQPVQSPLLQNQAQAFQDQPQYVQAQQQLLPSQAQFGQIQPEYYQNQPQLLPNQPQLAQIQPGYAQNQPQFPQNQPQYVQNQPQYVQSQLPLDQTQTQYDQTQTQYDQTQTQFDQTQEQYDDAQSQLDQNQSGFDQQPSRFPEQDNRCAQSGFGVNSQDCFTQQSQDEDEESHNPENSLGSSATAVSTAFGARIPSPKSFSQYGAPPVTTTEPGRTDEEATDEAPAIAVATAVADGRKRKSSKLRNRRIRPLYTLDKSGQLVQLQ